MLSPTRLRRRGTVWKLTRSRMPQRLSLAAL